MRNPLRAFTDPVRRPKAIIIAGAVLIAVVGLYGASMAITSTTWFCNDACHTVHADNKVTYYAGSHSEISCIACHYPPDLDQARFALDRVDKLLDLYPTITGTFKMPLNEYSQIGLEMPSDQCTQCHGSHRKITPTLGMKIDHGAHAAKEINCTICHNRVAHPEIAAYTLPGNRHHEDFMTMKACFRCHSLENTPRNGFTALGACPTCHTPAFPLKPASHEATGTQWVTAASGTMSAHARAAQEDAKAVAVAKATWEPIAKAFVDEEPRIIMRLIDVDTEKPLALPPVATIGTCGTCHVSATFCDPCHARSKVTVAR